VGKVRISRNPLAFRARAKPISVVLDEARPDLGAVGITVCEIPRGLLEEIRDDVDDLVEELKRLNAELAEAQARRLAGEERASAETRIAELKEEKKKARRELVARQRDIIVWGVCDHVAADFIDDETGEAFAFEFERGEYDSVAYKVASKTLIAAYLSAGDPFVKALYNAILRWQAQPGVVWAPSKVWEEHKAAQERLKALVKIELEQKLKANGIDIQIPDEALEEVDEIGGAGGGAELPLSDDPGATATAPVVEGSPTRNSTPATLPS
jgi:hypothetical protein